MADLAAVELVIAIAQAVWVLLVSLSVALVVAWVLSARRL